MLQPPAICSLRMILRALCFSMARVEGSRVWQGATTMESPVWMPQGSTFSMSQMAMAVSLASRITSNSISL